MQAATPSFPLPPIPTGHCTALSAPTFVAHSGLPADSHDVNTLVVPDSSARWTTWMGVLGGLRPGFCVVISGSFQVVTLPKKMSAAVAASSFSPEWRPDTL